MSSIAEARRKALNPFGDQYPDDNTEKEIVLQADGLTAANPNDRHVLLRWTNAVVDGQRYTQILHLTGGPGNYAFHTPQVKMHSSKSLEENTFHSLGKFTRAQRDEIIDLAKAVKFERTSRVNNCQTWMHDLLAAMVVKKLLDKAKFDEWVKSVPLKVRVAEA
ncbi:hypothetical protein C8Q77DRAFT_1281176 [Trametes polyzona]|nr:hypothetical protein C8Q77DRAFT_1281176 [Trametes polyzona]